MVEKFGKADVSAKIIADSISLSGKRMTTFELVYPRYILAELNTARVLSKNSASSRAVPYGAMRSLILANPATFAFWGKKGPGMSPSGELSEEDIKKAQDIWFSCMESVIKHTDQLDALGLHKSCTNRASEPWTYMKTVLSGTEFDNMLWLRNDDAAQPEFHELARCMQECLDESTPEMLNAGQWHLPYITINSGLYGDKYYSGDGVELSLEDALKVSASCCAQVSYRKLDETLEKALDIFNKLFSGAKPHCSPVEHQATPMKWTSYENYENIKFNPATWEDGITHVTRQGQLCSGNLHGWIQYRQLIPNNNYTKP